MSENEDAKAFVNVFFMGLILTSIGLIFKFTSRELVIGFGFLLCLTSIFAFVTRLYEYLVG